MNGYSILQGYRIYTAHTANPWTWTKGEIAGGKGGTGQRGSEGGKLGQL